MIAEFSIFHINECTPISRAMMETVKLVEASGLPYRLAPSSVSIEGEWDELFALIRRCHERVREKVPHVMTTISLEDEEGGMGKIEGNSDSIEQKIMNPIKGWKPKVRHIKPSKDQDEFLRTVAEKSPQ